MPCHTMFFSYCGQLLYSVLFCQQSCCPHICKQKIKLIYHIFRTCRICDRCCRSYGTCGACGAGWTGCSYWSICTNRTGCTWTPLWPGWACCSRHTNWSLDSLRPCYGACVWCMWLSDSGSGFGKIVKCQTDLQKKCQKGLHNDRTKLRKSP